MVEPVGYASDLDWSPATVSRVSSRGELPTLVALPEEMARVTVAGAEVVWMSGLKPARIRAAPIAPAAPPRTLATEPDGMTTSFAVDDGHVYYARRDGTIMRAPRAGGAAEMVTTAGGTPFGVAGDALYFWTDADVRRVPRAGGTPELVLASTRTAEAWIDGQELLVRTRASSSDALDGALLAVPLSGGAPRTLLGGIGEDPRFVRVSLTPTKIVVELPFASSPNSVSAELAIISRADGHVERRRPFHDYPLTAAASADTLYYTDKGLLRREELR